MINSEPSGAEITCTLCEKKGEIPCTGCGRTFYCSLQHLKSDLPNHKRICKPYVISTNETLGRFLQATRHIKQGEIILHETPLVVGPGEDDIGPTGASICFACCGSGLVGAGNATISTYCPICRVAIICGPEKCSGKFHSSLECELFRKTSKKFKCSNFITSRTVLPLRCYLNLQKPDGAWKDFFSLESHCDKRRNTDVWRLHHKNIIKALQKWDLIPTNEADEERMQRIMGVLDVNSFQVRCGLQHQYHHGRAVYLEAAMIAHDCYPNCIVAVDDNFLMTVKASRDIAAGQIITYNYTNCLHGTMTRRRHLLETKYFLCECSRCNDPTEFGTHLNSLVCPRCRKGLVAFDKKMNLWMCEMCSHEYNRGLIEATLRHVKNTIMDLDMTDIGVTEQVFKKLLKTLSPNHSFLIDMKQQLAVQYRDQSPTSSESLHRRKTLCEELLSVLEVLEPGLSRLRGIALYELHSVLLGLAQLTQKDDLLLKREAEKRLNDAVRLLLHEPPFSPEGGLARQALSELKILRDNLQKNTKKDKKNAKKGRPNNVK